MILQVGDAVAEPPDAGHPLEDAADLGGGERLGQVVERPPAHGLDGRVDRGVRRDDDDRESGLLQHHGFQQVEPRLIAEPEVDQDEIERPTLDPLQGVAARGRLLDPVAHRLQGQPEGAPDVRLVVHDQDLHGRTGEFVAAGPDGGPADGRGDGRPFARPRVQSSPDFPGSRPGREWSARADRGISRLAPVPWDHWRHVSLS